MLAQNVVKFNENSFFYEIEAYLNELEVHSKNTRIAYEKDIRQFFKVVKDTEIEHLNVEDLQSIKKKDIINYRKHLLDNYDLANSTINNKIIAPKCLYMYLSGEHDVNPSIFNIKNLKVNHNSYGSLSQTEAERFAEVAFQTESHMPYQKKMLLLFATRTSFRKNEILNIRWKDFEYDNGVYKVTTNVGKGQKVNTTSISEKLYNQIYEMKEMNKNSRWKGDPEIVFQITTDVINDMMQRLKKILEIPEERNIVFHSFRGVAIDFVLESTNGDITKAAIHANHSNPATTYKHYINKTKDYSQTPGVLMEEEMDLSFLEDVSLDEFKAFIKQSSRHLQVELKKFIEK